MLHMVNRHGFSWTVADFQYQVCLVDVLNIQVEKNDSFLNMKSYIDLVWIIVQREFSDA